MRDDPGELNNLWADADLRAELTEAFLHAEMQKEEPLTAESLSQPHKSAAMYVKTCNLGHWQIRFDPAQSRFKLFDLALGRGDASENLWHDPGAARKNAPR